MSINIDTHDLMQELATNFIEYGAGVNSDRAIPNATDGLKPVAKRIIYGAYDGGYNSKKPHVKCAKIVGDVMGVLHPHGDSSIYGALVRLAQPWVMRYPLLDFHGNMGNQDGDGPAAYRYTEARLSTLSENGLLNNIKKNTVDFIPNYDESTTEPIELPALFPNLLCNPNSGIGLAMACNWAPHNLREVAQAIYDYMDNKEPMLPGPDFPTGGVIINKNDIPAIMRTGRGSVKLRGKYHFEKNNIVFTEIPYGVNTETLMNQIGELSDNEEIVGVTHIRNESNKKGFRLVIECDKNASIQTILNKLFNKTNLQTSFSYNQVALVDKTPTELNLKDCIRIYIDHNTHCIIREVIFDLEKIKQRLHILDGLIKAIDIIDDIIAMIKKSESAAAAKVTLQTKWQFSEEQAKAILDMKLSKLAKLEKEELTQEKNDLLEKKSKLEEIYNNPVAELRSRLGALVSKYGDDRRTELAQIATPKEEKEIAYVEPEKVIVVTTANGLIKKIPAASFRTQKKNGKGVKNQGDITTNIIRTNTIDNLMIFSTSGKMYRLLVNDIPTGTNASQGVPIKSLVEMSTDEQPTIIYSIYRDTTAKFVLFTTKNGLVKKTTLEEYINTKKKNGLIAINIREDDSLASVSLINDEELLMITKQGMCIRYNSSDIPISSRVAQGLKGINLNDGDEILTTLPIRHKTDNLGLFTTSGLAKQISLNEFNNQKRGGKGVYCYKNNTVAGAVLINDEDNVLVVGNKSSICISCKDIPATNRIAIGNQIIKDNTIIGVTKI